MNKLCCLIIMFITCGVCSGQNLVKNPNFEDTISCANYTGPPKLRARHWFLPTAASTDFFNTSTNCAWGNGVPSNGFGFQYPHSLSTYLGFSIHNEPPYIDYREYATGKLADSLIAGHKYCVQFYVSVANNCQYLTDDIGAYFCVDTSAIINYNTNLVLNLIPQVENIQGNILSDTLNWMPVSGDFIAQGGEKFLTIGNFKNDMNTTLDTLSGAIYNIGYYYLDDVSVTDCTVGIKENNKNSIVDIYPNPATTNLYIRANNNEFLEIILYDITSRKIFNQSFKISTTINTEQLAKGIYLYEVRNKNGVIEKGKIVKD